MKFPDLTKLETWLHGLLAGVISAAATTGVSIIGTNFTGQGLNWKQLGVSLGISSLVAAFLYLQKSPLPDDTVLTLKLPPNSGPTTVTTQSTIDPTKTNS